MFNERFRISNRLGEGTFYETFLAQDMQRMNAQCVVKRLKPPSDPALIGKVREMFVREAEKLNALSHQGIPKLIGYFEDGGDFYLVQDFIDGNTLDKEINRRRKWTEVEVNNFLLEVLEILAYVHSQGSIHRDLKPNNIMRRRANNKLVLIDFGAVREVRQTTTNMYGDWFGSGTITIGTHEYMPAEQAIGSLCYATDVYAMGCIAIQALTGISPQNFEMDSDSHQKIRWRHQAIVSNEFAAIIDKMVRYNYRERFQNASEVLEDLHLLDGSAPKGTINLDKPEVPKGFRPPLSVKLANTVKSKVYPRHFIVDLVRSIGRFLLVSLFIRAQQNLKNRVTLHKGFKRPKFGARIIHDTNRFLSYIIDTAINAVNVVAPFLGNSIRSKIERGKSHDPIITGTEGSNRTSNKDQQNLMAQQQNIIQEDTTETIAVSELEINLQGNLEDLSEQTVDALVDYLQDIANDKSIKIIFARKGSIILRLTGTEEGFRIIKDLWESGKITELVGLQIESIALIPQNSNSEVEYSQSSNDLGKIEKPSGGSSINYVFQGCTVHQDHQIALSEKPVHLSNSRDTNMSENYVNNLQGANIANMANTVKDSGRLQANQHIHSSEQRKTLAESAVEIQNLLKKLEQINPIATDSEKVDYINNETSPNFKNRIVSAFQSGSETAIEEFLDNPYINVCKAIVKGWVKPV